MDVKVVDGEKGPDVKVVPSHEEASLAVELTEADLGFEGADYGQVAFTALVNEITLRSVEPLDIPPIRNGNSYVIRDYVRPNSEPAAYYIPRGGEISLKLRNTKKPST